LLPVIVFHAAVDSSLGYFLGPVPRGDLRAFAIWIAIITAVALSIAAGVAKTRSRARHLTAVRSEEC
jgi:membrane protein DedA with SNARE-associated domain